MIGYLIYLGSALAVTISFNKYRSLLWAFVHGLLSWLYIIYYLVQRNKINAISSANSKKKTGSKISSHKLDGKT